MKLITSHHDGEYLPNSCTLLTEIANIDEMFKIASKQFKYYLDIVDSIDEINYENITEWIDFEKNNKNSPRMEELSKEELDIGYLSNKKEAERIASTNVMYDDIKNYICDCDKLKNTENKKINAYDEDSFVLWNYDDKVLTVSMNCDINSNKYDFYEYFIVE